MKSESEIKPTNSLSIELVRALDEQRERKCPPHPLETRRSFIVISSVMTWAGSGSVIVAESDHWRRKRRSHPDYRDELQLERHVAAAVSRKRSALPLRGCVVCAGLTYGEGESTMQYAFKLAWLNGNYWLPVVGHGRNLVPLLHVRDLAK